MSLGPPPASGPPFLRHALYELVRRLIFHMPEQRMTGSRIRFEQPDTAVVIDAGVDSDFGVRLVYVEPPCHQQPEFPQFILHAPAGCRKTGSPGCEGIRNRHHRPPAARIVRDGRMRPRDFRAHRGALPSSSGVFLQHDPDVERASVDPLQCDIPLYDPDAPGDECLQSGKEGRQIRTGGGQTVFGLKPVDFAFFPDPRHQSSARSRDRFDVYTVQAFQHISESGWSITARFGKESDECRIACKQSVQ